VIEVKRKRVWPVIRSLLFAPGDDERKLSHLKEAGADGIVLDLEDAVALDRKTYAREVVRNYIPKLKLEGRPTLVRVNGFTTGRLVDDLESTLPGLPDGVVVPKVEDLNVLGFVDHVLHEFEEGRKLDRNSIRIVALVETALGISRCEKILRDAPERLERVIFGSGDFRAQLGLRVTDCEAQLAYARSRLVIGASAAGLGSPIDGPFLQIEDSEGLAASSCLSRSFGFEGRVVVHPKQVPHVISAYSPSSEELDWARKVVAEFESVEAAGSAAVRIADGFVDYPIYRQAKALLACPVP